MSSVLTRGEGLLEFVCLIGVGDTEGVKISGAPDLELGHIPSLLDLNRLGIFPASGKEEFLDLLNLLGLQKGR